MKNEDIEKEVFSRINNEIGWQATQVVYRDHPDVTCLIDGKKIAIELSEILDSDGDVREIIAAKTGAPQVGGAYDQKTFISKIDGTLSKKKNKDYTLKDHEVWLVCYANHISLDSIEIFLKKSELRSVIWQTFLKYSETIERVLIYDLNSRKLIVEAIKSVIQSPIGFGGD